jgi:hypothetical protein
VSGAPSRSLIILESLEAGLKAKQLTGLPRRRNRLIYFWLPSDVATKTRDTTGKFHVSQQALMRHCLFTYIASAPWKLNSRSKKPKTRNGEGKQH